jgi:hypothetical protein
MDQPSLRITNVRRLTHRGPVELLQQRKLKEAQLPLSIGKNSVNAHHSGHAIHLTVHEFSAQIAIPFSSNK